MSSDWVEVALADLIDVRHGFAFKGEYFVEQPSPHQLVTPGNFMIGGGFQLGKGKYYVGPVPPEYVLNRGDLVVTMTDLSRGGDTLGYAAEVPETKGTTWLHNQRVGLVKVKDPKLVDPQFLHYLMRTDSYRHWVLSSATGSTVKHTSPGRIRSYKFKLPPVEVQKEVGNVLTTIDKRITLFRETNVTLEAVAQALFKSWFVDFDPVLAKQRGLVPIGIDEATAAFFPASFEESPTGLVPKGWHVGVIGDCMELHRAAINPASESDTLFEHFSLPAFDNGQRPVLELGLAIKSNKTLVPDDAVLVSKLNPHIPRVWLPFLVSDHAVCSTEFLVMRPRTIASREFVYCSLIAPTFLERLRQLVTGTSNSHQRVKPENVLHLSTVFPPSELINAFTHIGGPLLEQAARNRLRVEGLTSIRDTLLPRLISGQLHLPEAEALAT